MGPIFAYPLIQYFDLNMFDLYIGNHLEAEHVDIGKHGMKRKIYFPNRYVVHPHIKRVDHWHNTKIDHYA